jgi:SAM-dependent methyltransferase
MHFSEYYRYCVLTEELRLPIAGERVLDVGSNDGFILSTLGAPLRVATDIAPVPVVEQYSPVWVADACALPFAGESFDTVLAFDVLEHVPDDVALLREAWRVLRPGGSLWFSTPSIHFRLRPGFLMGRANRAWGHVREGYTPSLIEQRMPAGARLTIWDWDEPGFRASYVWLRLMREISPQMARGMARWDASRAEGARGHLYGRIRKAVTEAPGVPESREG